eukprot:TRINITY_DN32090_c0_g1_i1.p1 TRINITY_DN32090_c0_g1~~TRINITY_DN32090_c0_g1_i1.p1  ORF type:complete len:655 (-),score=175.08 TRINITY_DN32090_c0_g1_i1:72-1982(-)
MNDPKLLDALQLIIINFLEIKDQSTFWGTYPSSVSGAQIVRYMLDKEIAQDEQHAVRIGKQMVKFHLLHHVVRDHDFENTNELWYRFSIHEKHGGAERDEAGRVLTWKSTEQNEMRAKEQLELWPLDKANCSLLDSTHPVKWKNPEPEATYNLVVIGAGCGGLVAAASAAGAGAKVALIEKNLMGGDCLNVGCVPSKALIRCARAAYAVKTASNFGVKVTGCEIDFPKVMERVRKLRAKISPNDSAHRFVGLGVDVFIGTGQFTSQTEIEVVDEAKRSYSLPFAKAVIATGATALIPDIPGIRDVPYYTNSTIFNVTELPKSMVVLGAGPIGCELGQSFQRLGAHVTIISSSYRLLPKEDMKASEIIAKQFASEGITMLMGINVTKVELLLEEGKQDSSYKKIKLTLQVKGGSATSTVETDLLLISIGRKANVEGLNLESARIETSSKGVAVNDFMQTTNPNVYAVGDVCSDLKFTHNADFMARAVIRNAIFFGKEKASNLNIPRATYTDPEVAQVGMNEEDMKSAARDYDVFCRRLEDVDRAILDGEEEGFVKVICDKGTDNIVGATIVASHAGDMISELTVAMDTKVKLSRLATVIHPYPTQAEAVRQTGDQFRKTSLTPTVKSLLRTIASFRR